MIKPSSRKHFFVIGICSLLIGVSAVDPFAGLIVQPPCFEVIESPTCKSSLFESFQAENPTAGINDPSTMVYLFTPTNPDRAEQLHLCGGQLPPDTQYDPSVNTEIFIHGWFDGVCRTAWMRESKEQLFLRGKYNVILVDWTWGNTPDYNIAGKNSRVVGEQVGFIIKNIMKQKGVAPEKFHLIGHSFGAIASGFTGRAVPGLRRITGLDPAFAPLKNAPPEERLTYRDAQIVDIIHSGAGKCFALAIGDERFLGHADFYPNGGKIQLSCIPFILKSFLKGDILSGLFTLLPQFCNHLQSQQYYKVSINPEGCEFVGVASTSYERFLKSSPNNNPWAVMGMNYELYREKDDETRRKYYLKTKLNCPYYDDSYLGDRQFPFNTSCSSKGLF